MIDSLARMRPSPGTSFTLDGQLCFALYSASRAMTAAYRDQLAEVGLTYTQYITLLALWEHEPMAMRDLSDALRLNSATLSPVLRRMERDGLVTRRRLPEDERVVEVACTDRARALLDPVSGIQRRVEVRTGLDEPSLVAMRDDLHELADRLRDEHG